MKNEIQNLEDKQYKLQKEIYDTKRKYKEFINRLYDLDEETMRQKRELMRELNIIDEDWDYDQRNWNGDIEGMYMADSLQKAMCKAQYALENILYDLNEKMDHLTDDIDELEEEEKNK